MKEKITISVDSETLDKVDKQIEAGTYRNRSHAFEHSVKRMEERNG